MRLPLGRQTKRPTNGNDGGRKMAKRPAKTKAVQTTADTAEPQKTAPAKKAATDKQFADADLAALRGLPADLTVEQHENIVRKSALGY
jgi:hypothetical protein